MEENIKYKAKLSYLKGTISEDIVRWFLQETGMKLIKTTRKTNGKNVLNIAFMHRALFKFFNGTQEEIEKIIQIMKDNMKGLPDFICLQDNKLFFVEVKNINSCLNEYQVKTIKRLIDYGYEVKVYKINLKVEFSDPIEEDVHKIIAEFKQHN